MINYFWLKGQFPKYSRPCALIYCIYGGVKMSSKLKICFVPIMVLILALVGCTQANEPDESSPAEEVIYEAIFLDNDEITDLFTSVRGETAPFENVTKDYHVTTEFMPEEAHPDWYGEQVSVHITAYAVQDIEMDDGKMTSNEGFKVEVTSENKELASYLDALNKNYHITGAYKDGAKYTEYIDFSAGDPMDTYIVGTFGGYYSDGTINLGEK